MNKELSAIIFAGAIWGIAEGTIGWLLHLLHVPHVALWLSPVIIGCIVFTYRVTGQASSVAIAAIVAALIKCCDLLIPIHTPIYYVLHPAIYIVIEGIAGAVIIKILNLKLKQKLKFNTSTQLSSITLIIAIAINLILFVCR